MDIASLGLEVRSDQVSKATSDLNRLTNAAKVAANAANGLTNATGRIDPSAIAAMARNMGAVTRESNAAARALAAEALAAQKAAAAGKAHSIAVNDNIKRMGGGMSGLAAQFQDIGVTAAMGMNPVMIALQQGTQIAGQMEMAMQSGASATGVFAQAFRSLLSPVTLASIALTAVAAAGLQMVDWSGLAASALNGLADVLQTIAPYAVAAAAGLALVYAPALIGGIATATSALWGMTTAVGSLAAAIYSIVGLPALVVVGLVALAAAAVAFRDDLTNILGVDIVGAAKTGANYIIGSFVAAFHDIQFVWKNFGNIIGAAIEGAVNAVIKGVNAMVQKAASGIDTLIGYINKIPGVDIAPIGNTGDILKPWNGGFSDALSKAVGERSAQIQGDLNRDYLGNFGSAIAKGASAASSKLKELAKDIATVDDKSKKKGGKTEAEKYSDIVDGANRRIASLKAEQAALGMTEQAALKLKYETDLLNQAQQKGITLTAAQRAELSGLAGQMASTEIATKKAKEAMDFAKDATKGFLSDLRSGLQNGEGFWKSFGNAALNVLDKIIGKIEDQLVDALFSVGSAGTGGGGGGIFGSILSGIGAIFGFASGGYTGNRAASSVAGVVHGGEYVFSKRATDRIGVGNLEAMHRSAKGYASGGYVAPAPAPANQNDGGTAVTVDVRAYVDDNGNWQAEVEKISQKQVGRAAPGIVNAAKQQAVPAMAEYQANVAGAEWR